MKAVWATVIFHACAALSVLGGEQGSDVSRSWTSASGTSIEAVYLGLDRGMVKLRAPDGNIFAIGEHSLSDEDRQWIEQEETRRNVPAGIQQPAEPNQLPVFKGGEWHGRHVGYTARSYDAWMDSGGVLWVHPKVNGSRVGRAMKLHIDCYYRGDKQTYNAVPVISFKDRQDPMKQPGSISLSGILERNVPFNVRYEFSEDGIKVQGNCEDPPKMSPPTVFRMRVRVAASHNLKDFASFDEMKEVLKDWTVTINPIKGKIRTIQYGESVHSLGGVSQQVTIDSPDYDIIFKTGNLKVAPLSTWIYSGKSPWEGYSVICSKNEGDIKSGPLAFDVMIK